jgi:hypothetical protein
MSNSYLRSWTFSTPTGELVVSESAKPDTVQIAISAGVVHLTKDQFQALASLASYSTYCDYVHFATEVAP